MADKEVCILLSLMPRRAVSGLSEGIGGGVNVAFSSFLLGHMAQKKPHVQPCLHCREQKIILQVNYLSTLKLATVLKLAL